MIQKFSEIKQLLNAKIAHPALLLVVLLYRVLLDLSYVLYVEPLFYYADFKLEFSFPLYLLSYIVLIGLFQLTPQQTKKPSELIIQIFFLMVYVPFSSYFALNGGQFMWYFIFTAFWAIVLLTNKLNFGFSTPPTVPVKSGSLILTVFAIVLTVFAVLFYAVGFNLNFNLLNVYEIRSHSPTAHIPFSGYFLNWTAKVLLPLLLLYALNQFKFKINYSLLIIVGLIFLMFSITGHKVYLFNLPFVLGIYFLLQTKHIYFNLISILCLVVGVSLTLFLFFGQDLPASLFIRRTLFIPAQISTYYYDFFNANHIFLSNSIFKHLIEYPYEINVANLIGKVYRGSVETSANNGIIADGFMHFGVAGVFLWALLFVILLKLSDSLVKDKPKLIFWVLLIVGFRTMIDGAFFTTLMTHGLLLTLLLCYLYPKYRQSLN